jgi:glucose dehydrogenase
MGILILVLAGLGLLAIVLNYMDVLPGGASNWYLLGGLVFILSACLTGTRYH